MPRMKEMSHIEVDRAGLGGRYLRLTCMSCGATLLEKPYWTQEDWDEYQLEYLEVHRDPALCGDKNDLEI